MKPIIIPETYNYTGVFLTLSCNLNCSYCINKFGAAASDHGHLTGKDWVEAINRLVSRDDLPVTIQGGEPSLHRDFFYILNNIKKDLRIDLLTNLQFDVADFMTEVRPERFDRNAPYASIRVSYHPQIMELEPLVEKVLILQHAGYSIGIWGILHPEHIELMEEATRYCHNLKVDFRTKEFLGMYDGRLYGTYKYTDACSGQKTKQVQCRTTELLVGPSGAVYRCHSDLYEGREAKGNLGDPRFVVNDLFHGCTVFGKCNPCDVKLKTNRYQTFGHTSVQIRFNTTEQEEMVTRPSGI